MAPTARIAPSGDQAKLKSGSTPGRTRTRWPVRSHRRTDPPALADATIWLSGDQARQRTGAVCPVRVATGAPAAVHRRAVSSWPSGWPGVVARSVPSGDQARVVVGPLIPARDQAGVLMGAFAAGVSGRVAAGTEEPQAVPAGSAGSRLTGARVDVRVDVVAETIGVVVGAVRVAGADVTGAPQAARKHAVRVARMRSRRAWAR